MTDTLMAVYDGYAAMLEEHGRWMDDLYWSTFARTGHEEFLERLRNATYGDRKESEG